MSYLDDLLPSSFRGVPFLVPKAGGTFGRNTIDHLYPDSNNHYVEDNGALLKTYKIEAVLHGTDSKNQFLALKAALEAPGPGTMLHPWLGAKFVNVADVNYAFSQRNLGVIRLSITFKDFNAPVFPALITGSSVGIGGLTANALTEMVSSFIHSYKKPVSLISFDRIKNSLVTTVRGVTQNFRFAENVLHYADHISSGQYIYQSDILIDNFKNLYRSPIEDDSLENDVIYRGWSNVVRSISNKKLYEPFDVTTVDLRDRNESLKSILAFRNGATLIHYCEAISHFDYLTADHVARDRNRLSSLQSTIAATIHPDSFDIINDVVIETLEYLGSLEIQLPKIETMDGTDWPVGPLAYQLYGPNTDRTNTLININQDNNLMLFDGDVSVLRDG